MRLSSKEQKNLQKNKPYKGFSRFRTDLSLVGLTCALYVLFLIVIMLHGHRFCFIRYVDQSKPIEHSVYIGHTPDIAQRFRTFNYLLWLFSCPPFCTERTLAGITSTFCLVIICSFLPALQLVLSYMPLPLAAVAHRMPVIIACGIAVIFNIGIHQYGLLRFSDRNVFLVKAGSSRL